MSPFYLHITLVQKHQLHGLSMGMQQALKKPPANRGPATKFASRMGGDLPACYSNGCRCCDAEYSRSLSVSKYLSPQPWLAAVALLVK